MLITKATLVHSPYGTGRHVYRLGEFPSSGEAGQMVDRHPHVSTGRATLIGAGLGAWLGLLAGLALAVSVAGTAWLTVLMGGTLIGAAAGAAMGLIIHRATDGRRDSGGTAGPPAQHCAVHVDGAHAATAGQALDRS